MKIPSRFEFQTENSGRRKRQARSKAQEQLAGSGAGGAWAALKSGALKPKPAKAEKPRRRGRPRIEGRLREPNGRISRAANPPALAALQARAFHNGLTLEQAKDPRAASYLGRLAIFGREDGLSCDQYDAAQEFLRLRNDYRRALLSPGAYYEATGTKIGAENMEEYTAWVKGAKKRYAAAIKAVQEAQIDNGKENLFGALQYVVINDTELPYLLGAARMALNALHRHFKRAGTDKSTWEDRFGIGLAGLGSAAMH